MISLLNYAHHQPQINGGNCYSVNTSTKIHCEIGNMNQTAKVVNLPNRYSRCAEGL